jgi:hypothetical protein
MKPFYITTPIYYVNDVPHLGHAYTTIAADTFARYHRMRGDDTRLLTGTDEHGQKVEETAKKRGITPRQLTDEVAPRFVDAWKQLGIQNDDFIRTTESRHARVVHDLWRRISAAGDLYLATYQGWYCVGCEAFYTESQLEKVDDAWHCTTHKRPVDWVDKERSWFFRLSKYAQPLLDYIAQNPTFIQPEQYRNEVGRVREVRAEGSVRVPDELRLGDLGARARPRGPQARHLRVDGRADQLPLGARRRGRARAAVLAGDLPPDRQGHPPVPRGVLAVLPDVAGLPLPRTVYTTAGGP